LISFEKGVGELGWNDGVSKKREQRGRGSSSGRWKMEDGRWKMGVV
jgi:hypothetical protein